MGRKRRKKRQPADLGRRQVMKALGPTALLVAGWLLDAVPRPRPFTNLFEPRELPPSPVGKDTVKVTEHVTVTIREATVHAAGHSTAHAYSSISHAGVQSHASSQLN